MVTKIKRVGREFDVLLSEVKQEFFRKGLRLSDTQASDLIAKEHWRMKCNIKDEPKKKFFQI